MAETKQPQVRKKAGKKGAPEVQELPISGGTKKKLRDLDDFIEGVLQEAGEEFLEEFKQIEGE